LKDSIQKAKTEDGPIFIEIVIRAGARDNLGRPLESPIENKKKFMEYVRNN
jgi:phosphonopyruvate decarboxylase